MVPKPIVKWAGGKSKLIHELLPRIPTTMRTYAEPFAGGAAIFFALAGERSPSNPQTFERAILADQNPELVACYRAVRSSVDDVIEALRGYRYDKDLFYATRDADTRTMSDVARAARFIFLNRTCFNGLWRVNGSGKFNVPFGRYKNPTIVDAPALRAASRALARADVRHGDFLGVTSDLERGDFVYLDPPYVPVTKTADFTSYVAGGFHHGDQVRLAEEFRRLRDRGILAMLSNADTPVSRELYADFAVHQVLAPRAINSDPSGRGAAREIVVTSWGPPGFHALPRSARRESEAPRAPSTTKPRVARAKTSLPPPARTRRRLEA